MSKKRKSGDPFDAEFKRYARHFREKVLPKITQSAHFLALAPAGDLDVEFATQIGAAIMLDKPIVLLVPNERTVPPKLARIADKIIAADLTTEAGREALQQKLTEYLNQ